MMHRDPPPTSTSSYRRTSVRRSVLLASGAFVFAFPLLAAVAAPFEVPNTFSDGQVIRADAFNENFEAIADALAEANQRIAALEANRASGGDAGDAFPSGAVVFFDAEACPPGWESFEEAEGRTIIGVADGMGEARGTLLGMVGDPLDDLEDRSHSHTVPSIDIPSSGGHIHQWWNNSASYNATGSLRPFLLFPVAGGAGGIHVFNFSGEALYTSANGGQHTHTVPSVSTGSARTSAVMPYLQLLACRRT